MTRANDFFASQLATKQLASVMGACVPDSIVFTVNIEYGHGDSINIRLTAATTRRQVVYICDIYPSAHLVSFA